MWTCYSTQTASTWWPAEGGAGRPAAGAAAGWRGCGSRGALLLVVPLMATCTKQHQQSGHSDTSRGHPCWCSVILLQHIGPKRLDAPQHAFRYLWVRQPAHVPVESGQSLVPIVTCRACGCPWWVMIMAGSLSHGDLSVARRVCRTWSSVGQLTSAK